MSTAVSAALVGSLALDRRPWHRAAVTLAVGPLFLYFGVDAALQLRG